MPAFKNATSLKLCEICNGTPWLPGASVGSGVTCPNCRGRRYLPPPSFETAQLYTTGEDNERMSCESPEEAIVAHFNGWLIPRNNNLREWCPVKVRGFQRKCITRADVSDMSDLLFERFVEHWDENLGDPEESLDHVQDETCERIRPVLEFAVMQAMSLFTPWQCTRVGDRIYEYDEVLAILNRSAEEA